MRTTYPDADYGLDPNGQRYRAALHADCGSRHRIGDCPAEVTCHRCGLTLRLVESGAPRFVHPGGEAVCPIDNEAGEADSGAPDFDAPAGAGESVEAFRG